ncbi:hypothetical protein [Chloroflexus sp.]|uniref:hypothetical protein n=1 Tax=Chloroflexus sp. TaxID=1904827 RepID=UPI002631237D|nr:hypothetical protein [uncultured Chloroflexus sp.]
MSPSSVVLVEKQLLDNPFTVYRAGQTLYNRGMVKLTLRCNDATFSFEERSI